MRTDRVTTTFAVTRHLRWPSPLRRRGAFGALLMTLLLLGGVAGAQSGLTVWSYAPSFVAQRWLQEQADAYALATGTTVTWDSAVSQATRRRVCSGTHLWVPRVATRPAVSRSR